MAAARRVDGANQTQNQETLQKNYWGEKSFCFHCHHWRPPQAKNARKAQTQ